MIGELFDPNAELLIGEHYRPHWSQAGAVVFVTFRTCDSIPKDVLNRWHREKLDWLNRRGIEFDGDLESTLASLPPDEARKFRFEFNRQREQFLDDCFGQCVLRSPELSAIVADSLLYFDGTRYRMGDFVVMPNHVHLLVAFADAERMKKQFASWLHFTAHEINQRLGESGSFWQEEPFDHLVRSPEQYDYLRKYIRNNPKKARLSAGDYHYREGP